MRTSKRMVSLILTLLLICSVPVFSFAEDTTEITVWMGSWWSGQVDWMQEQFAKDNPGYTCKIELQPIANYTENAVTAIVGGNSPDVMALDTLFLPTMISQGLLDPLDDFMDRYALDGANYVDVLYNAGISDGQVYALPYRFTCSVLFYNKTLFDNAGVAYPTDRMEFDAFRDMTAALTIPGQQYGYGIAASKNDPANVMSSFCPFLWGFGGDFLNSDLAASALSTEESISAIDYWVQLYYDGLVPEGCINYAITADLFPLAMNQTVAMIPMGDNNIVKIDEYAQANGFEWGVVLHPGYARAAGWSYSIPISAKHKEGAEIFINWFLQPEVVSQNTVCLPGVKEAQSMGKWADPLYDIYSVAAEYSIHCPNTPAWTQIQTIVTEELQDALTKVKTPAEAAALMAERVDEIME